MCINILLTWLYILQYIVVSKVENNKVRKKKSIVANKLQSFIIILGFLFNGQNRTSLYIKTALLSFFSQKTFFFFFSLKGLHKPINMHACISVHSFYLYLQIIISFNHLLHHAISFSTQVSLYISISYHFIFQFVK